MTKEELLKMELHEEKPLGTRTSIMRVYGGWIYHFMNDSVFVPEELNVNANCID